MKLNEMIKMQIQLQTKRYRKQNTEKREVIFEGDWV